ncbi:MAG: sulfatase-like hydrolase/transferase [Myxococcales bacterium]|nr:sulfatase-like hydrolase/transferase [Myxococcales bacterium]MDH5306453.1 sulfatase-like hydrolase/transferase [Myxococcales bacterium]MDH5565400.1 sulfatase-like hydrolase/transferase [Myxococcales bacterium]
MRLLASRWFLPAALLAMLAVYLITQLEVRVDARPKGTREDIARLAQRTDLNVLFVLIDTLRADRLGAYGYERPTSPGIDYLAATGARFARQRAQSSWTKASMASLWTALYPARTGVLRYPDALPDAAQVPAEVLQAAGFVTAGIWRNGWVAPNFGFRQGFEIYQNPLARQSPDSLRRNARAGRIAGTDIDLVLSAMEFLRVHRDQRWFLYVHFMDVHQYVTDASTARFGTSYSDSYDNAVLWVDRQLQGLVGELERLGLRDRTLVVVASDHGEAFGEHWHEGHARDLYREVTHTPLVLSFPFRLDPGVVVEVPTQNVDLWPTLLALCGLPPLPLADGRSRLPELLGGGAGSGAGDDLDFAQLDRTWGRAGTEPAPLVAVREGSYRLIHDVRDPSADELYDLAADPQEFEDIAAQSPELTARLAAVARRHFERDTAWPGGAPRVELDDMSLRQLRALGYAVE